LNVNAFYEPLLTFLNHVVAEQFIEGASRQLILAQEQPEALLQAMTAFEHPKIDKAKLALAKKKK